MEDHLKTAVMDITMPEEMKSRIIQRTCAQTSPPSRPAVRWKRALAVALAAALCLTLSVPALATQVVPIYKLMYFVSPSVAQYFQPVQKSCVDNGIQMEVVSAYIHDDTAEIYLTMQDLTGDRVDGTIDLFDSYAIYTPFDSASHCTRVGYDAETKTATFLVSISRMDNQDIVGNKVTFTVAHFLSHIAQYENLPIPMDLTAVPQVSETQRVQLYGGSGSGALLDELDVLLPSAPAQEFPVEGIDFTGMAFVNGKLHIQVAIENRADNDNHGDFYLQDGEKNQIGCEGIYYFSTQESAKQNIDYIEYVFPITPEKLAECTLFGNFSTAGQLTEGDWKVTFPIQRQP